jgi:hypothetical protein
VAPLWHSVALFEQDMAAFGRVKDLFPSAALVEENHD